MDRSQAVLHIESREFKKNNKKLYKREKDITFVVIQQKDRLFRVPKGRWVCPVRSWIFPGGRGYVPG